MENLNEYGIDDLFEKMDPSSFLESIGSIQRNVDKDFKPIQTFVDEYGLTLSAISDRRLMQWIVHALMPLAGRRVLEIGSGTGFFSYAMAQLTGPRGTVEGCEIIPDLFSASMNNDLVRATPWMNIHHGDFVDVVPALGAFDAVVATSAMSYLHPAMLNACKPDGGIVAFPIELRGGGDCYTVFRRQGDQLETMDSLLSISVPTTGRYSPESAWAVPIETLHTDVDLSSAVRLSHANELGHHVYGTLRLRSFLQAHEASFTAVTIGGEASSFAQNLLFGLIADGSFCLQEPAHRLLGGRHALLLAEKLALRCREWEARGRESLADYSYRIAIGPDGGISFEPALLESALSWRRR